MIFLLVLVLVGGAQSAMWNAPVPAFASHLSGIEGQAYDR